MQNLCSAFLKRLLQHALFAVTYDFVQRQYYTSTTHSVDLGNASLPVSSSNHSPNTECSHPSLAALGSTNLSDRH